MVTPVHRALADTEKEERPTFYLPCDTFIALCVDDKCPWKFRGVTGPQTNLRGQEHADETGHEVTVYFEHRWTLEPRP